MRSFFSSGRGRPSRWLCTHLVTTLFGGVIVLDPGASPAADQPTARFHYLARLGLTDGEHTDASGARASTVHGLNAEGYSSGISRRYGGGGGETSWIADPNGTTRAIGLFDDEHTRADGFRSGTALEPDRHGIVVGHASRFIGNDFAGVSAWISTLEGTPVRIGLFDQAHTAPPATGDGVIPQTLPGTQFSAVDQRLDDGRVIGRSVAYSLPVDATGRQIQFETAWLADPSGLTVPVGLFDAEHTYVGHGGPFHHSRFTGSASATGMLSGVSLRFGDAVITNPDQHQPNLGQSAWIRDPDGTVRRVGLLGERYTRADGWQFSRIGGINASGYGAGSSTQITDLPYSSAWTIDPAGNLTLEGIFDQHHVNSRGEHHTDILGLTDSGYVIGETEWFDEGGPAGGPTGWIRHVTGSPIQLGLDGPEYTNSVGLRATRVLAVNEAGQTVGYARRLDGSSQQDLFLANAAGVGQRIGLTGPEYVAPDGSELSEFMALSEAGHVFGFSVRYAPGSSQGGFAAWVATADGGTERIGFFDAVHTRSDGFQGTSAGSPLAEGYWVGYSQRFHGDNQADGVSAWLYDAHTGTQVSLVLSIRPSDGYASTWVHRVTADGMAVGTYRRFDEDGTDLGDRAFAYVPGRGAVDLGDALEVNLEDTEWLYLAEAQWANTAGFIAGAGVVEGFMPDDSFLVRLETTEPPIEADLIVVAFGSKAHGLVGVAVLSDADFSASAVDRASVRFGAPGFAAQPLHHTFCDVDRDGDKDLVLLFRKSATGLSATQRQGILTGATKQGREITGVGTVLRWPCRKKR